AAASDTRVSLDRGPHCSNSRAKSQVIEFLQSRPAPWAYYFLLLLRFQNADLRTEGEFDSVEFVLGFRVERPEPLFRVANRCGEPSLLVLDPVRLAEVARVGVRLPHAQRRRLRLRGYLQPARALLLVARPLHCRHRFVEDLAPGER